MLHFTTRADDSHAIPKYALSYAFELAYNVNVLVRFCGDYRIKSHVPPYVKSRQFF